MKTPLPSWTRIFAGLGAGAATLLLWPAAAFAGFCPHMVNCTGGSVPLATVCAVGAAVSAALCLPGGEWKDNSDDFGGGGGSTTISTPAPGDGGALVTPPPADSPGGLDVDA